MRTLWLVPPLAVAYLLIPFPGRHTYDPPPAPVTSTARYVPLTPDTLAHLAHTLPEGRPDVPAHGCVISTQARVIACTDGTVVTYGLNR